MRFAAPALGLVVVLLLAGCGGEPPPDEATSRQLIESAVLNWHRLQAAGDGAACRLATDEVKERMVESDRQLAEFLDAAPAENCEEAMGRHGKISDQFRELMLNTQVDAVRLEGERATVTAHTSAVVGGVRRQLAPAQIRVRWDGGRWLIG